MTTRSKTRSIGAEIDEFFGKEGILEREAYAYYTGQIIEQARKGACMTQAELAEKIGTTSHIFRAWRQVGSNRKFPLFITLLRLLGFT